MLSDTMNKRTPYEERVKEVRPRDAGDDFIEHWWK
jgi:hypothetical protein